MAPQRNIRVQGILNVAGTAAQPVSINGRDGARWGGISFESPSGPATLAHLIIRGATKGYDATLYSSAITGRNANVTADFVDIDQSDTTFYMYNSTSVVRDSTFHMPYTGDGLHIKKGTATLQRCVFSGE
jgi:hypothetical protein